MTLIMNNLGEFVDPEEPQKLMKLTYHNPNDRMFHPVNHVRQSNRLCARCGRPFYSQQSNHIYCSADCQRQADNERRRAKRKAARNAKS